MRQTWQSHTPDDFLHPPSHCKLRARSARSATEAIYVNEASDELRSGKEPVPKGTNQTDEVPKIRQTIKNTYRFSAVCPVGPSLARRANEWSSWTINRSVISHERRIPSLRIFGSIFFARAACFGSHRRYHIGTDSGVLRPSTCR